MSASQTTDPECFDARHFRHPALGCQGFASGGQFSAPRSPLANGSGPLPPAILAASLTVQASVSSPSTTTAWRWSPGRGGRQRLRFGRQLVRETCGSCGQQRLLRHVYSSARPMVLKRRCVAGSEALGDSGKSAESGTSGRALKGVERPWVRRADVRERSPWQSPWSRGIRRASHGRVRSGGCFGQRACEGYSRVVAAWPSLPEASGGPCWRWWRRPARVSVPYGGSPL